MTARKDEIIAALKANGGNVRGTARDLGVPRSTVKHHWLKRQDWEMVESPTLPGRSRSIAELKQARAEEFGRIKRAEDARDCVEIKVKTDLPIGILHFGDPHIDNPGTDIDALYRHVDLVNNTPGMYAANVGDTTDNWVGRLRGIYGSSAVTEEEAWKLAEDFVLSTRWLYMIAGNHDCWSGEGDPLKWISQRAGCYYERHSMRLELVFANKRRVRINARHDFKGRSEINDAHQQTKAAKRGFADHILISGHRHTSGQAIVKSPDPTTGIDGGRISHCLQVASYKYYDDYGKQLNLHNNNVSPCVVTVINPRATQEIDLITPFWNPERGAQYLSMLRAEYGTS